MTRQFRRACAVLVLLSLCFGISCGGPGGGGGGWIAFEVGGETWFLSFEGLRRIPVQAAKQATLATNRRRIFDATPTDRPSGSVARLPSSNVAVFTRATAKEIVRGQALPLTGTAHVSFLIAPGDSADPCADGILLAEYDIAFNTGVAAILEEAYTLSERALAIVLANDICICIQINADFDADFAFTDLELIFGTETAPPDVPTEDYQDAPAGTTIQVPIDSVGGTPDIPGVAVVAPVTHTIGGVDYGVVGVLDVHTPAVPVPSTGPSQVSLDLNDLGLQTVQTLYMATLTAWVPDLPDGLAVATLTCSYAEGSATTLDLVLGENTSEWSYDRPEHVTDYDGVQHARAPELYSFPTRIDSASEYTGYVYSVSLSLDSTKTLACLSLTMAEEFGGTGIEGDEDGDGVPDESDECPNTPAGEEVDEVGCHEDVTVEETFTGLAEETGGDTLTPPGPEEVPDSIITVIEDATEAGGSYDVLFIIDNTGSMRDDIDAVKASLDEIIDLMEATGDGTQRAGVMTYADVCVDDPPLVKLQDMTTDLEAVRTAIQSITLAWGDDWPESVYDAIVYGMDPDNFTFVNPVRFAVVIGDAPPHSPGTACYETTFPEAVEAATATGVEVILYTIIVPAPGAGKLIPQGQSMPKGNEIRAQRTGGSNWAGQAFSAITLEGPAGTPSVIGDCSGATTPVDGCLSDGDCGPDETCVDGTCVPGADGDEGDGVTEDPVFDSEEDFDRGTPVGVVFDPAAGGLRISEESTTLPFIWVPNSNQGTISKVDTLNGNELGRYRVSPEDRNGNPSRTTVDLQGSCFLGNRATGTMVKVGLFESGGCVDRNGNGSIDTSSDLDGDGDITGEELLAWGEDECVLYEVILTPGEEGTYTPGTFTGTYPNDDWNPGTRGIAVDSSNNVWVGSYGTQTYFYVNGATGEIIRSIDVSSVGHHPYGAVLDPNGVLWSSTWPDWHVLKLDTADYSFSALELPHQSYGLAVDRSNHLFVTGRDQYQMSRINILADEIEWTVAAKYSRGIALTADANLWTADSNAGTVTRWTNDGTEIEAIPVGSNPTGVAVDANGYVWVVNYGDEYAKRINPATNAVDLEKALIGTSHYGYSDMTGIVARTVSTQIGNWTADFSSAEADTVWDSVVWDSDEPVGTSITVRVRSSSDRVTWSEWFATTSGADLSAVPPGKYLQIEATLQILSGDTSPTLYSIEVLPED